MEMNMESGIIETLKQEHDEILNFIEKIRQSCIAFMEENKICSEEFFKAVEFIRNYADKRHHQKEEQILFEEMIRQLGKPAVNLIQYGMLVEHELARFYVRELETSLKAYEKQPDTENKLDIISHAMSYYFLLKRHIEKENTVVFPYAQTHLSKEILAELDRESDEYEKAYRKDKSYF